MVFHVEQCHGAKLQVALQTTFKKHELCSTIGPLTLLSLVSMKRILCVSCLERHQENCNKLLTVATCCSEGFWCKRLSLLEAIALGFVIYLVYQHFMKLVQFILLRHGPGRKKDG